MLATCFALCVLAVRAGDVVVLPPSATPVLAGGMHWALRDAVIPVAPRTRAIILRLAPDGLSELVEVRLFDGTDRLAWLEQADLVAIQPPSPASSTSTSTSTSTGNIPRPTSSTRSSATSYRSFARRWKRRPDFRQVDAAIAGMMQVALANAMTAPRGMPVYHVPVIPVESVFPIVSMPVYQAPMIHVEGLFPVYRMPTF